MARNNFQYEKRQRELDKKRKAEEKARRKQEAKSAPLAGEADADADTAALPVEDGDDVQDDLDRQQPAATPNMG